jgi:hypothetical protein
VCSINIIAMYESNDNGKGTVNLIINLEVIYIGNKYQNLLKTYSSKSKELIP